MHAATAGQVDTVNMLLKRGADSAERDNMGWTALHHAVSSGGLGVTKALVESGADIHAKTANGATGKSSTQLPFVYSYSTDASGTGLTGARH